MGHVSDVTCNPSFVGTTIRNGKEMDSIQTYSLLSALTSSTGLRVPKLLGNWEHLLEKDTFSTSAVPLLRRLQKELIALSWDIEQENKTRQFKMESFNPMNLECSVSV